MQFIDTIKLAFGHNLVIGNTPQPVELEKFGSILEKDSKIDVESFGLFETATPNYATYYPDVNAEDLKPKESEFVEPTFRALSEVIVHRRFNPVDFSMNNVLKKSMKLLQAQSIYIDHEPALGNALGSVKSVDWQNSYKTEGGIVVPAGINAILKIDGKSNPRIARGILMDPPSIHSTSVTVEFNWERSHPDIEEREFFNKLGSFDKDGKMIRRVATLIRRYHEISLVSHGADPFAQKVDKDGKIVNPVYADISNNSEAKKEQKFFYFDFKSEILKNNEDTIPDHLKEGETELTDPLKTSNNKNHKSMTFLQLAAQALGMANHETATEAEVTAKLTTALSQATTLGTEVTGLKQSVTDLKTERDSLKAKEALLTETEALKTFENTITLAEREEVKRLYKIVSKGVEAPAVIAMIDAAKYDSLKVLRDQYAAQADATAPLSCKKCGSTDVNRASAKADDLDPHKKDEEVVEKSLEEVQMGFLKQTTSGSITQMHG